MCLLQSGGGGRDGPVRHVTCTSRIGAWSRPRRSRSGPRSALGAPSLPLAYPLPHPGDAESAGAGRRKREEKARQILWGFFCHTRNNQETITHRFQDVHNCSLSSRCDDLTRHHRSFPERLPSSRHVTRSSHSRQTSPPITARGDYASQHASHQRLPQCFPRGLKDGNSISRCQAERAAALD